MVNQKTYDFGRLQLFLLATQLDYDRTSHKNKIRSQPPRRGKFHYSS